MSIAEAVQRASAYLTEHPDEARYRDSAATARIEAGLVATVTGPGGERITTDMPQGIGGTATAPSPGWLLRAATASCVASLIAIRAAVVGVETATIEVEVDSESDDRGILGLDEAVPAGALSFRVIVRLTGPDLDGDVRQTLVDWAVAHCPVSESLGRAVPLSIDIV
ncbi:MAG TPA: OsmC family protein [Candidatus Limnocylindrales bacterium]|nr:OsmC family protein [Candidatus Limnocylindrales bacterium]